MASPSLPCRALPRTSATRRDAQSNACLTRQSAASPFRFSLCLPCHAYPIQNQCGRDFLFKTLPALPITDNGPHRLPTPCLPNNPSPRRARLRLACQATTSIALHYIATQFNNEPRQPNRSMSCRSGTGPSTPALPSPTKPRRLLPRLDSPASPASHLTSDTERAPPCDACIAIPKHYDLLHEPPRLPHSAMPIIFSPGTERPGPTVPAVPILAYQHAASTVRSIHCADSLAIHVLAERTLPILSQPRLPCRAMPVIDETRLTYFFKRPSPQRCAP
jgi:hypothetical protein